VRQPGRRRSEYRQRAAVAARVRPESDGGRDLVDYRKQHGPFQSRDQLLQVPGIGDARYTQAAGF